MEKEQNNKKTTVEDLTSMIQGMMQVTEADPQDCLTALGQMMVTLCMGFCDYNENTHEVHECVSEYLGKIQGTVNEYINEHPAPEEKDCEYLSFDQIREKTAAMAVKLNENEIDKKNRINACNVIMDTDNYGFLLLANMKDGSVSMSSNLKNGPVMDNMLGILRETLYGDGQRRFKINDKKK